MKKRESVEWTQDVLRHVLLAAAVVPFVAVMGFYAWIFMDFSLTIRQIVLALSAVFAVTLLWSVIAGVSETKDRESAELVREQERAEQRRRREAVQEEARLREQSNEQARLKEAQAYREEVERFHRDRLSLEPFVVGDVKAGIRSPYEVEMTPAETALLDAIAARFDPSCLLVDTYLDKGDGTTTQIDIIAICRQGIIVIESKGLGGTWSGKWDDKEWIQQSSQRRIYNPIRQNDLHVNSISRALWPTQNDEDDEDDIPF